MHHNLYTFLNILGLYTSPHLHLLSYRMHFLLPLYSLPCMHGPHFNFRKFYKAQHNVDNPHRRHLVRLLIRTWIRSRLS